MAFTLHGDQVLSGSEFFLKICQQTPEMLVMNSS